ncbi:MAG: exodeoxyribonuclease small subunit [Gammaproteobacteria bacterium]|nr:exodeoxyribonuclease small subunit [Gammaproteobacteria bacterium]
MTTKKQSSFDFEKSLTELTQLVEEMEAGGDSLEVSLKKFEKGILLTRECQKALEAAEQKVEILLQQNGKSSLIAYENDEDE